MICTSPTLIEPRAVSVALPCILVCSICELGEAKASHLLWMLGNGYMTLIFHGSSYSAGIGANAMPAYPNNLLRIFC
jgi:hypothetical protein